MFAVHSPQSPSPFKTRSALFFGASLAVLMAATPALAQQVAQGDTESVIVTGTRVTGMTAADSAAPITVVGSDTLSHVGQPNLIQALAQNLPSFNAESFGGDTANLTLSARLRGISPNDTLVLVNGKRRHTTANLHVLGGQYQGAATADLDLIPVSSIDHIEVLQDGAAAQYGTDAIAGVVNIILKKNDSGGTLAATGGQFFQGDGSTYDFTGQVGFPLGTKGFINFTLERRYHGFTQRGGQDPRVFNAQGTLLTLPYDATKLPGYPYTNPVRGDAQSQLNTVLFNAGYEITPEVSLYSFGSYGRRIGRSFENDRVPTTTIALATSNQQYLPAGTINPGYTAVGAAGTCTGSSVIGSNNINPCFQSNPSGSYTSPGEFIFSTVGYLPQEVLREDDFGYTVGAKGEIEGWTWDLSGTYGKDKDKLFTENSANNSLYIDTHMSPTNFYDGAFIASQLTGNLDITRQFNVGAFTPLSVAVGFEAREDTYAITPGDPASYYKTGAQSFPGYSPGISGSHSRKDYSQYIDLSVSPIEALQIDVAGRHENYSDFGDAFVGKITARYDFNPMFAVRGTIASGFRAPTLPEEFYTATNVSPTSATVQLGPNSVAAASLGLTPLKPESSSNYSIGLVTHPLADLSITVDAYSIAIGNRIVGTGTVNGKNGGVVVNQTILNAITLNGNNIDPAVPRVGITAFENGVSTLTDGVDLTANYASDFGGYGSVSWTVAASFNETTISRFAPNPTILGTTNLFTPAAIANLTTASPKQKVTLGALWSLDDWTINLREVIYGVSSQQVSPDAVTYYKASVPTTGITDLEISNALTDFLTATVGANNLFNQTPPVIGVLGQATLDSSSVYYSPNTISPYGINGGYYYGRVTVKF